jgi:hypothetical protein
VGDRTRFTIHDNPRRKGLLHLIGPLLDPINAHYRRVQMRLVKDALEKDIASNPSA